MQSSDQLTLRSIRARLRAALEQEAGRRGQSLNKTVLALLEERLGLANEVAVAEHHDLDELAGTWSKADGARFEDALEVQRQVDPKLWR